MQLVIIVNNVIRCVFTLSLFVFVANLKNFFILVSVFHCLVVTFSKLYSRPIQEMNCVNGKYRLIQDCCLLLDAAVSGVSATDTVANVHGTKI